MLGSGNLQDEALVNRATVYYGREKHAGVSLGVLCYRLVS